jgi:asparagine synthase (glutamine-hydrolysing)
MSNWFVCLEADEVTREAIRQRVVSRIAPFPGLHIGQVAFHQGFLIWAASPEGPVSVHEHASGACVVFGLPHDAGRSLDAQSIEALFDTPESTALDGFFTALRVGHEGVRIAADLLGMAPVYHWWRPGTVLAGSSAHLFNAHPSFHTTVDIRGMVALLLVRQPIDGRTTLAGVTRLEQGCVLAASANEAPREIRAYSIPVSDAQYGLPFAAHVHNLRDALQAATSDLDARSVFLSGGLDSRLVAGFGVQKRHLTALSLGVGDDNDARLGRRVAVALGMTPVAHEVPLARYRHCARLAARWEHVQNGFSNVYEWDLHDTLRQVGGPMLNGLVLDLLIGGTHLGWVYDPDTRSMTFDRFWKRLTRLGLSTDSIMSMARSPEVRDAVDDTYTSAHRAFHENEGSAGQRAWLFHLTHLIRTHVARVAWVTSFSAWPQMPLLDRRLIRVAGEIPSGSVADRRCQQAMLVETFPALAEIPIDRNGPTTYTLTPRFREMVGHHLRLRLKVTLGRDIFVKSDAESRRYVRTFDFNNEGWRAIRVDAEKSRERFAEWFEPSLLGRLWPAPDVTFHCDDMIVQTAGLKSLLGLSLMFSDSETPLQN